MKLAQKLLILSAILFTSCSESSDSNDETPCTPSCQNNISIACSADGQMSTIPCVYGCDGTACAAQPMYQCAHEGTQCSGNTLVTCSNGKITQSTICQNGCQDNACIENTPECTHEGAQCSGNTLVTCSNGKITQSTICQNGCQNNACIENTPECTHEGAQCSENTLVTCSNGKITQSTICQNGCQDNACIELPEPTCKLQETMQTCEKVATDAGSVYAEIQWVCESAGDDNQWTKKTTTPCESGFCDKDNYSCGEGECGDKIFSQSCNNNAVTYCQQNEIYTETCSKSKTCITFKDGIDAGVDHSECLSASDICTTRGARKSMCIDYGLEMWNIPGGPYVAYDYICEEATNGKLYWYVPTYIQCDSVCNSAGTACK